MYVYGFYGSSVWILRASCCIQERRQRSKLPRALRGLMGEANIRYARGEKEDAITMCMEIIRQGECEFSLCDTEFIINNY